MSFRFISHFLIKNEVPFVDIIDDIIVTCI